MRRPGQSGDDGSFGRSAGMQPGRGAALLVVAVLLGIVLLNAADDAPPDRVAAGTTDTTSETTLPEEVTTTVVTLPARAPADVKVIAANGTGTKGVARKATDQLKAAGYNVLSPTDASAMVTSSNVFFVGDFEREAGAVATNLGLPTTSVQLLPTPPPLADARGATVIVVVGPELAAMLSGSTTATTAAGATTTTSAGATTTTAP